MALVEKSVLVGYAAEQMFDLVSRLEDYPAFMPWCDGAEVKSREPQGDGTIVVGTLRIRYAGLRQSFTTRNTERRPGSIDLVLVDGPFRMLAGRWTFKALSPEACKVEFRLQYEFSNRLFEGLVGPVFGGIANSFVDSFTRRADEIHGSDLPR